MLLYYCITLCQWKQLLGVYLSYYISVAGYDQDPVSLTQPHTAPAKCSICNMSKANEMMTAAALQGLKFAHYTIRPSVQFPGFMMYLWQEDKYESRTNFTAVKVRQGVPVSFNLPGMLMFLDIIIENDTFTQQCLVQVEGLNIDLSPKKPKDRKSWANVS